MIQIVNMAIMINLVKIMIIKYNMQKWYIFKRFMSLIYWEDSRSGITLPLSQTPPLHYMYYVIDKNNMIINYAMLFFFHNKVSYFLFIC